jgi:hypothetical protein
MGAGGPFAERIFLVFSAASRGLLSSTLRNETRDAGFHYCIQHQQFPPLRDHRFAMVCSGRDDRNCDGRHIPTHAKTGLERATRQPRRRTRSVSRRGVARWRRGVINGSGKPEQLRKDRFQRIGPDLICLYG